jgi:hypothetical protein
MVSLFCLVFGYQVYQTGKGLLAQRIKQKRRIKQMREPNGEPRKIKK